MASQLARQSRRPPRAERAASSTAGGAALADKAPLRCKLRIGASNDALERQADATADRVVAMPDPARVTPTSAPARAAIAGRGQPLPAPINRYFGRRLGHDFGNVRVHTDASAAELARSVDARAFTIGRDVVFGAGRYAPSSTSGRWLLAHELTHVVQQANGAAAGLLQRAPDGAADGKRKPAAPRSDLTFEHIIRDGETFESLQQDWNTTTEIILDLNPTLKADAPLPVGTTIRLPLHAVATAKKPQLLFTHEDWIKLLKFKISREIASSPLLDDEQKAARAKLLGASTKPGDMLKLLEPLQKQLKDEYKQAIAVVEAFFKKPAIMIPAGIGAGAGLAAILFVPLIDGRSYKPWELEILNRIPEALDVIGKKEFFKLDSRSRKEFQRVSHAVSAGMESNPKLVKDDALHKKLLGANGYVRWTVTFNRRGVAGDNRVWAVKGTSQLYDTQTLRALVKNGKVAATKEVAEVKDGKLPKKGFKAIKDIAALNDTAFYDETPYASLSLTPSAALGFDPVSGIAASRFGVNLGFKVPISTVTLSGGLD
ncbi:MAG: DUF4157 domain-containing protein, partial [Planctomycetes bacterium]|nr:DUF4157 domain-containing protein [Planctomycetota bacterium]